MDIQFSVKKRLCLDSRIQSSTTPLVSACYASTANAIIFINDSGEYYISDVYLENSLGPRPCGIVFYSFGNCKTDLAHSLQCSKTDLSNSQIFKFDVILLTMKQVE
uniref:Uncharacterized protein n=1 Tax=Romanomermis culicivorax TaxID=13658 RepID=A0A915KDN6_ROMCU